MILIDANLLIYAIDADSPHHTRAKRWLEETLSGDTWVALPWVVILAFLRITTRTGILRNPLPPVEALAYVDSWLAQPYVRATGPGDNHWPILRNLLRSSGTAGNLTSDAHLAALALEHGCTIASADNDFRRFAGVTHINPLAN
ncbi:MAG TPA: type II toxin-antitoxin system VapC family toxin [Burkholderiales bacterium]|nr:type II toxin-antitoxin system VapC family toxin [Burkholderiales bacterium]